MIYQREETRGRGVERDSLFEALTLLSWGSTPCIYGGLGLDEFDNCCATPEALSCAILIWKKVEQIFSPKTVLTSKVIPAPSSSVIDLVFKPGIWHANQPSSTEIDFFTITGGIEGDRMERGRLRRNMWNGKKSTTTRKGKERETRRRERCWEMF